MTGPFDPLREYIRNAANMADLCEEIIEWHDTAVLRDGKVRLLAKRIEEIASDTSHSLQIVESLINEVVMRHIIEQREYTRRTGRP